MSDLKTVVLPEPEHWLVESTHKTEYLSAQQFFKRSFDIGCFTKLYTEQQVSALLAEVSAPAALAVDLPTVQLIGVNDGVETDLGQVPMPPTMKARELLRDVGFTGLDDDDGDGAYAMGACEQLIEYCQAYYGPQALADARDAALLDFIESHAEGVIRLDAVPNYLYWGKHWEHKTARAAIAAAKGE